MKSKSANVVLVNPKVNLEFLTTSILGLINAIDWFAPPVFAVMVTVFTGFEFISVIVSTNWNLLSLILLTKYVPVPSPVAFPSYNILSPVSKPCPAMSIWFVSTFDAANVTGFIVRTSKSEL